MDFSKLLSDNLVNASQPECEGYYKTVQIHLRDTLLRNGHAADSEVAKTYAAGLAAAIRQHRLDWEKAQAPQPVHVPQPTQVVTPAELPVAEPASPAAPVEKPAGGLSGLKKTAVVFAVGALAGMLLSYVLTGPSAGPVSAVATALEAGTPQYLRNVEHVRAMQAALDRHRQTGGRLPASENFDVLSVVTKDIAAIASISRPEGVTHARLYYKSKGNDYKLMFNRSGDCFIARIKNPELVDPVRVTGAVDCQDYGVWTAGGKDL